jgi:hypothetical protein
MNNEDMRRLAAAASRVDFASFVHRCFVTLNPSRPYYPNWHILAIAHRLEEVRLGDIRRLIINVQPQTLKSLMTSVAFPAFLLGHDPTRRIIVASHSTDLATKHHNDFRAIISERWYQDLFPGMRISGKNSESKVVTTRNGYRLAASIDGTLTGRGGNPIIIDDPLNAADALSEKTRERINDLIRISLLSRLDDPQNGAVILVMQRLDDNDPTGALLRSSDDWTVLKLPAIAEREEKIKIGPDQYHVRHVGDVLHAERVPLSVLHKIRAERGADVFAAQYQQAPVPPGGVTIKREWIRRYDFLPPYSFERSSSSPWCKAGTPPRRWAARALSPSARPG